MVSTTAPQRQLAAVGQAHARDRAVADQQIVDLAFDHREIRGLADRALHRRRVELAVGLRARARAPPGPCGG